MANQRNYLIQYIHDPQSHLEKFPHSAQPGHQYVRAGDTIQFAPRNTDVIIIVPNADQLFQGQKNNYLVLPLAENQLSQPFTIKAAENQNVFPYAVYCRSGNGFAEGGSSPEIIVED